MIRYNISVPRKYTQNNVEKTAWNNVGRLIKFEATQDKPESFILELAMFPDTKFGVFEDKPKTPPTPVIQKPAIRVSEGIEYPEEVINPGDIPF